MQAKSRLIVLSAPSGAGKTTLCDLLLKEFPNITLSISATTREMRPYEKNGVHYHFLSEAEFDKRVANNDFIEWAVVHGKRYGTLKSSVENELSLGRHVLFDIDVQGAQSLKSLYADRVVMIFIHPPSMKELEKRLIDRRGDSATSIEARLQNAYNEVQWSRIFTHQILNDDLNKAYQQLRGIIKKECP